MNILVITQKVDKEDDVLGFFHRWVEKLAQELDKVFVICLSEGKHLLPNNVKIYSLGKEKGFSKLRQFFRLQKFLLKHLKEVDGIFIHMCPIYAISAFPLAKIFRKKMILWYVHRSINWELRLAEKLVNKILTTSPESCRLKNKEKIEVMSHGIDTERFRPLAVSPLSADKLRILFIGRIAPIKDLKTLILALDILINQKKLENIELKIIGDASEDYEKRYKEEIKNLIAEKKLENYIKLFGSIPYTNIIKYYQGGDILINLSPAGGMDKVVLEAMACKLPVLVCNKAFEKDLARFRNTLIFKEKNSQDLAQKIYNFKDLNRVEIGDYLRNKVVQNHNLNDLIGKIVSKF